MPRSTYGMATFLLLAACTRPASRPPEPAEPVQSVQPARPAQSASVTPEPVTDEVPASEHEQDGPAVASADHCPETTGDTDIDGDGCPDPAPPPEPARLVLVGIHFEARSAKILPAARPVLDRVVDNLQRNPEVRVEIGGHTDRSEPTALGARRAEAVLAYLKKHGVAATRLEVRNFAAAQQVDDTAIGQARSRQIVFTVLPGV